MYRIAIVEDESEYAETLKDALDLYGRENGLDLRIKRYTDGQAFLGGYKADYDVIFMDIEMPHLDGMQTAHKIREIDEEVCLIFVTRMAQYALQGYEVRALDFLVKPIQYQDFAIKFRKALKYFRRSPQKSIPLEVREGTVHIAVKDIYYIEVVNHELIYHTKKGEYSKRGSINEEEIQMKERGFARCGKSYLVNLYHVSSVKNGKVIVNGVPFSIGRAWKKEFLERLAEYMGEVAL